MENNIAILTIAGSDSGGGAGIQADLKTFSALGVYGTTVITSITAQNLKQIVDIYEIPSKMVEKQINAVLQGYPIKAIKTGILLSEEIVTTVINSLKESVLDNNIKLVVDPIMIATSGKIVIDKKALNKMQSDLFPLASLITPNIPETEYLTGKKINTIKEMEDSGAFLFEKFNVPFLIKGGHLSDDSTDILISENGFTTFKSKRVIGINTHGSGCTLSAAITTFLSQDYSIIESVQSAKDYLTTSLTEPLQISNNTQIINHFYS
jgi:hydroxymethylpyrimidine/phosphomethylpyrimidine kinase